MKKHLFFISALFVSITASQLGAQTSGWTDDGTVVRLTNSSDNVGIGTSTPNATLSFGNVVQETIRLYDSGTDWSSYGFGISPGVLKIFAAGTQSIQFLDGGYNGVVNMSIVGSGNVGIGTTTPQSKLAVNGKITATEVEVTSSGWPDFVFAPGYNLKPLTEVEQFIQANGHLPELPSVEYVKANGIALGENQALLLQKIEELTLYVIALNKENQALKARVDGLER